MPEQRHPSPDTPVPGHINSPVTETRLTPSAIQLYEVLEVLAERYMPDAPGLDKDACVNLLASQLETHAELETKLEELEAKYKELQRQHLKQGAELTRTKDLLKHKRMAEIESAVNAADARDEEREMHPPPPSAPPSPRGASMPLTGKVSRVDGTGSYDVNALLGNSALVASASGQPASSSHPASPSEPVASSRPASPSGTPNDTSSTEYSLVSPRRGTSMPRTQEHPSDPDATAAYYSPVSDSDAIAPSEPPQPGLSMPRRDKSDTPQKNVMPKRGATKMLGFANNMHGKQPEPSKK